MDVTTALNNATNIVRQKFDPDPAILTDGNGDPSVNSLVSSFFNIPNATNKDNEKMQEISEWVGQRAKTDFEFVNILKDIRFRLGTPKIGMSTIDNIYKYVRIRREAESMENQAKAMEI